MSRFFFKILQSLSPKRVGKMYDWQNVEVSSWPHGYTYILAFPLLWFMLKTCIIKYLENNNNIYRINNQV